MLVINADVEANKNTRTNKSAIQTAGGSNNTRSFIGIIGIKTSIKIQEWEVFLNTRTINLW